MHGGWGYTEVALQIGFRPDTLPLIGNDLFYLSKSRKQLEHQIPKLARR
ncbi:hypothetical protein GCM10010909_14200 [Acidocella aquatica]|uniref:Uncharacterized protein n=1 Tax=Acidocella aquatica TaxID=1922313 RepID=A0ABQ6A9I6_9PROT|nr:hypothetical protein GCM10010909_14200 [Acidocella aquatica]